MEMEESGLSSALEQLVTHRAPRVSSLACKTLDHLNTLHTHADTAEQLLSASPSPTPTLLPSDVDVGTNASTAGMTAWLPSQLMERTVQFTSISTTTSIPHNNNSNNDPPCALGVPPSPFAQLSLVSSVGSAQPALYQPIFFTSFM